MQNEAVISSLLPVYAMQMIKVPFSLYLTVHFEMLPIFDSFRKWPMAKNLSLNVCGYTFSLANSILYCDKI